MCNGTKHVHSVKRDTSRCVPSRSLQWNPVLSRSNIDLFTLAPIIPSCLFDLFTFFNIFLSKRFRGLWAKRKRNAMDVVDMIADGMDKKPKVVMVCIET